MVNRCKKWLVYCLITGLLATSVPLYASENSVPVADPVVEEQAPTDSEDVPSKEPTIDEPLVTVPKTLYNDGHYPGDNLTVINGILLANKKCALGPNYTAGYGAGVGQSNALYGEANSAMNAFLAACNAQGHHMYVISGYRSYGVQKYLFASYAAAVGEQRAAEFSSRPGYSEHQTGLTFDVGDAWHSGYNLEIISEQLASMKWMKAHCADYGFILRYPKGKEKITGYQYEPWHFRYVGVPAAKQIMQSGMTLEEFLGVVGDRRVASGSDQKALRIDGEPMKVSTYFIDGHNYFRLRDLATLLNQSNTPFNVDYDEATRTVVVQSHSSYTDTKTLVKLSTKDIAVPIDMAMTVDGIQVSPKAYTINGYNYFKLRDLGKLLDFVVDWDAEASSMVIETEAVPPIKSLIESNEVTAQDVQDQTVNQ